MTRDGESGWESVRDVQFRVTALPPPTPPSWDVEIFPAPGGEEEEEEEGARDGEAESTSRGAKKDFYRALRHHAVEIEERLERLRVTVGDAANRVKKGIRKCLYQSSPDHAMP